MIRLTVKMGKEENETDRFEAFPFSSPPGQPHTQQPQDQKCHENNISCDKNENIFQNVDSIFEKELYPGLRVQLMSWRQREEVKRIFFSTKFWRFEQFCHKNHQISPQKIRFMILSQILWVLGAKKVVQED